MEGDSDSNSEEDHKKQSSSEESDDKPKKSIQWKIAFYFWQSPSFL